MAPTQVLCRKHYRGLTEWLQPLGVKIAFADGVRRRNLPPLEGEANAVVGTHALLYDADSFPGSDWSLSMTA